MNNKVDFVKVIVFAFVYILVASTGYFLIKAGEEEDGKDRWNSILFNNIS